MTNSAYGYCDFEIMRIGQSIKAIPEKLKSGFFELAVNDSPILLSTSSEEVCSDEKYQNIKIDYEFLTGELQRIYIEDEIGVADHLKKSLIDFPHLEKKIETFIDWDEDNFSDSMKNSDILLTWNLPTNNLEQIAPKLKWIHCIGAGVEHLSPFDWLPSKVFLTNNKGVHKKKAGEFGLMSLLMLHNHFPKAVSYTHLTLPTNREV